MRKRDTTSRGDLTEFEVATALTRAGKKVLRPLSAGLRYDLVLDNKDGSFSRVQCKTGLFRDGAVEFRVYMADGRRPHRVPYHSEVDAFGVHCPQTHTSYLVPMTSVASLRTTARLRLLPPRNGQTRGIRLAREHEIGGLLTRGRQEQRDARREAMNEVPPADRTQLALTEEPRDR